MSMPPGFGAWDEVGGREWVPAREANVKRAALCYKRGVEAMEKQDWDLASEMFAVSVKFCPDKLNFRQLLRICVCKRYKDNKTGAAAPASWRIGHIRERVEAAKAAKEWRRADVACEEGLALNPWDTWLNIDLAEVARAQGFLDIARFSLAFALALDPRNREILVKLADRLWEMGLYEEVDRILRRLDRLGPPDE